jgi:hypothetical protein
MDGRAYPWGETPPALCAVNSAEGRRFLAAEIDRQNPPRPPEASGGCSCVTRRDAPPPPPTVLPAATWDADQSLPPQALEAIRNQQMEWTNVCLSPYGLLHAAGNAAEWVNDAYDNRYYLATPLRNPLGPDEGRIWSSRDRTGTGLKTDAHVYRGGSYLSGDPTRIKVGASAASVDELAAWWRGVADSAALKAGCDPSQRPFIGFRCARSIGLAQRPAAAEPPAPQLSYEEFIKGLQAPTGRTDRLPSPPPARMSGPHPSSPASVPPLRRPTIPAGLSGPKPVGP